jgi:hypothetical protein
MSQSLMARVVDYPIRIVKTANGTAATGYSA